MAGRALLLSLRRTAWLLLVPSVLAAQQPALVSGRVIRLSAGDTVPQAGASVVRVWRNGSAMSLTQACSAMLRRRNTTE